MKRQNTDKNHIHISKKFEFPATDKRSSGKFLILHKDKLKNSLKKSPSDKFEKQSKLFRVKSLRRISLENGMAIIGHRKKSSLALREAELDNYGSFDNPASDDRDLLAMKEELDRLFRERSL